MRFFPPAGAALCAGLLLATHALAQPTPDSNKQPAQSLSHEAPQKQQAQSLSHGAAKKQQDQSTAHGMAEGTPMKQKAQSLSHGDSGIADGVTKQH